MTKSWHLDNPDSLHRFNDSGASLDHASSRRPGTDTDAPTKQQDDRRTAIKQAMGHDEILRAVLIQEGIISGAQIEAMTDQLVTIVENMGIHETGT